MKRDMKALAYALQEYNAAKSRLRELINEAYGISETMTSEEREVFIERARCVEYGFSGYDDVDVANKLLFLFDPERMDKVEHDKVNALYEKNMREAIRLNREKWVMLFKTIWVINERNILDVFLAGLDKCKNMRAWHAIEFLYERGIWLYYETYGGARGRHFRKQLEVYIADGHEKYLPNNYKYGMYCYDRRKVEHYCKNKGGMI